MARTRLSTAAFAAVAHLACGLGQHVERTDHVDFHQHAKVVGLETPDRRARHVYAGIGDHRLRRRAEMRFGLLEHAGNRRRIADIGLEALAMPGLRRRRRAGGADLPAGGGEVCGAGSADSAGTSEDDDDG
jgi:hypothetical protein